MPRFLADEDFNNHVVKGLQRRSPATDIVRVQDVGLGQAKDPLVLLAECSREHKWEGRVIYLPL